MQKRKKIYGILILIVIAVTVVYIIVYSKKNNAIDNVKGNLVISTFSESTKGNMVFYDVEKNKEIPLIRNSNVAVNGDLSEDGKKVVYVNALDDSDPWEVYVHKVGDKSNKDKKITDNENGKASPRLGTNNSVYYLTGDTSGIMQIGKTDTETNICSIIDNKTSDCKVDAMDIKDDKVIMSSTSNHLYEKQWEANDGEDQPITHSIYETDKDGENLKNIVDFQASAVDAISYTPSGCEAVIGAYNMNGEVGHGIYKVSLKDGKITVLLNSEILSLNGKSIVSDFANPNLCKMSIDEKFLYFTGVEDGDEVTEIDDIECYPTAVFRYDLESKETKKIYEPKEKSFIFDLNIKY